MRLTETGALLALISAYDNRNFNEETAAAWYDLLGPYTLAEAKHAVKKHYSETRDLLMPADVLRIIKTERRARLAKVETIVPSRADMTDTAAELATTKALSKAIASGELTPDAYEAYVRGNTPWATTGKNCANWEQHDPSHRRPHHPPATHPSAPNLTNHRDRNGTSPTACRDWKKSRGSGWNRNMGDKVTNPMPGNPYADWLKRRQDRGNDLTPTVQATLALAHEQRTLTLVNVVRMYADLGMAEHTTGIIDAITNRLGGHDHE